MFADLYRYRRYTTLQVLGSFLVRIHPFLQIFTFLIPVVAQIVFWRAVYGEGVADIGGYTVSDVILYLIVIKLIEDLTWAYPGHIQSEIRFGELTEHLLRPASYSKIQYFKCLGTLVTRWMNAIILILIVFVLFHENVVLTAALWTYSAGLLSVCLTYHLRFAFMLCIAFLSFWIEGHPPFIGHMSRLFGGSLVPLTFLPAAFQQLSDVLPFKFMLYFPTSVFLGKVSRADFLTGTLLCS